MMFPFLKTAVTNLFKKPSTVLYPFVPVEAKPNYRGRISYDPEKCVNCGMCMKVCSPQAITRVIEPVDGGEQITYTFDLTSCTFCAMCQDFCSSKAIRLTEDYHMAEEDSSKLVTTATYFKKKQTGKLAQGEECVYCTLCAKNCPEEAITVDRDARTWTLDESKCVKCGTCVSKCPKKCLHFEEAEEGVVFNADNCVFCTLCAKKCPVEAITVDRNAKTWEINRETCIKCGACVKACHKKTLSMGEIE